MTIPPNSKAWVADSGLFIACGRQENTKYIALERFATHNQITFIIPQQVYEELTGAPAQSTPGQIPIDSAIASGWVTVAEDLDYTNSTVSTVLDRTRSYIANSSNRPEDQIERADTTLAGVAVQLLLQGSASSVCLITTDIDAGQGTVTAIEAAGFTDQITLKDGFELIESIT
ncbi:hypothetical protein [Halalkalicoccus subterraneus]|uniref:hypothetical protein n=1 Tax=Halalkalicoccus subterraneus TaxID=2675002 RepID=UPI000EFBD1ED|nr:hypothetical protein [Halalkalicoccus subterraneus]